MGVVYKLNPQVRDYIIDLKNGDLSLSCRKLILLIQEKFQIQISKSSINSIMKNAGLSQPVGRRRKKRRRINKIVPIVTEPRVEIKPLPVLAVSPEVPLVIKPEAEPSIQPEVKIEAQPEVPPIIKPETEPLDIQPEKEAEVQPRLESQASGLNSESRGMVLLQAMDYLIGGSFQIAELVKKKLDNPDPWAQLKTEAVIYQAMFGSLKDVSPDSYLLARGLSKADIDSYCQELRRIRLSDSDASGLIHSLFQQARGIRLDLVQGESLYFDAQFHTIWSTPYIPYDFSATLFNLTSYIDKYFKSKLPLIIHTAPGYDTLTKEFFSFLSTGPADQGHMQKLTIYGHNLEEIESIALGNELKPDLIFAFWPWQFQSQRKVKSLGEFKPFLIDPLGRELYLADIEVDFFQSAIAKRIISLKGVALKKGFEDKISVVILTNASAYQSNAQDLAERYLSRWPNLEEGFKDFSQKIELFTYAASSQHSFTLDPYSTKDLFTRYSEALEAYLRWSIFPLDYEKAGFSQMRERFYDLKVVVKKHADEVRLTFLAPKGYAFTKDLDYACRRLNEKAIPYGDNSILRLNFLENAF